MLWTSLLPRSCSDAVDKLFAPRGMDGVGIGIDGFWSLTFAGECWMKEAVLVLGGTRSMMMKRMRFFFSCWISC